MKHVLLDVAVADPTLADLAGTGPPRDELDGSSLVPFLKHPEQLNFPTPTWQGTQNKTLAFSQYPVRALSIGQSLILVCALRVGSA